LERAHNPDLFEHFFFSLKIFSARSSFLLDLLFCSNFLLDLQDMMIMMHSGPEPTEPKAGSPERKRSENGLGTDPTELKSLGRTSPEKL
jgi:hypothetical protein